MPDGQRAKKRTPQKKITHSLVALGSAAIVSVYAAGYARTQSAAAQFDVQALPTSVMSSVPVATEVAATRTPVVRFRPIFPVAGPNISSTGVPTSVAAVVPTIAPTVAPTAAPASSAGKYRDGSYVGLGRSRHGNIEATVVVQGGKIVSAKISQCLTRYPCSMIDALPGQVVAQQSAAVDFVSGATDSSTAYQQAVANALAKGS
ncbi:MAG: FMN-binding protein [Thermomicrobiales bacterium]